ncbi:FadR/GntR family transcriptional regulator [Trueperella sp. LYQ141]|uniref:FadR/GntR family transcriptional regulator n=1 Tax=Trueperella sp. LYQ141 TaxID=3391058 RepID=UPI0039837104
MNRKMSDNFAQAFLRNQIPTTGALPNGGAEVPVEPISAVNRSSATMNAIKAYILNRGLKPGDPLPTEARLCDDLGVSRSSVREALRKLEALDIIRVYQGRGSFVGEMSLVPMVETLVLRYGLTSATGRDSLRNVVSMRRYIDLGAADSLVTAMAGTSNPHLDELVATMIAKAEAGHTYLDEDIAFHNGMNAYVNNELLTQLTGAVWLVHQAFIPELNSQQNSDSLLDTARAHGNMLRAAEAGDTDGYRQAIYDHYQPLVDLLQLEH